MGKIKTPRFRLFQRCEQPAQQHGRRIPSISSVRVRAIWSFLVSGFLTDSTQQIHSLRARGVISSHAASAARSAARVFRKSAGIWCTVPAEIPFLAIFNLCTPLENALRQAAGLARCEMPRVSSLTGRIFVLANLTYWLRG